MNYIIDTINKIEDDKNKRKEILELFRDVFCYFDIGEMAKVDREFIWDFLRDYDNEKQ